MNYDSHSNFEACLEAKLSEEELLTAFFVSWNPSAQIFKEEDKRVWLSIKAAMERAKTLLITRQYFEKKWFLNSCRFIKNLRRVVSFEGLIEKDILKDEYFGCHPCKNTSSMKIRVSDLTDVILPAVGHDYTEVVL